MWIRVESFAPDSTTPSTTLNFWTDRFPDGGTVLSVGRKAGDVIFPNDKSVSRQHCEIKCLKQREGHKDVEQQAIEASPFDCALVVENHGKSGTFIAELPQGQGVGPAPDVDNSDDDATDDEGMVSQHQTQQKSQLAPLGDGQEAPEGLPFSACTKELWGQQIQSVKMVKVDMNESRLLDFSEPRSIVFQVGVHGSTIKISWIPLRLVFSRLPGALEHIKRDLSKIGATEDSMITSETTHLVSPKATVSAKPLAACCRGLPIMTPEYLMALMAHAKPDDPVPPVSDFLAPYDQNLIMIKEKGANPRLMQGYTVFFLDNVNDMEALVHFSGGTSIALYDLKNETDRLAKVQATMTPKSNGVYLVLMSKKRLYNKLLSFERVYSLKPEAWAASIFLQNPQLKGAGGEMIPTPAIVAPSSSTKKSSVIKAIPKQAMGDDDSDTDDEIAPSAMTQKSKFQTQEDLVATNTTATRDRRSQRSTSPKKIASPSVGPKRRAAASPSPPDSQFDSSMTELDAPTRKRRKRGEPNEPIMETPMEDSEEPQHSSAEVSSIVDGDARNSDKSMEQDFPDFPMEQDEAIDESQGDSQARVAAAKITHIPVSRSITGSHECLDGVDENGWYAAAPKADATRKAWRQKASKLCAGQDGEHFQPAAGSKTAAAVVAPSQANPSQNYAEPRVHERKANGPDFRTFRKNIVPRKIDDSEIIQTVVVQPREDQVLQELEEEQRQLEVQQRVADELFRDVGSSMPRRKRRE